MIEQKINQELKEALLSGNKAKVSVLRFIKSIVQDYKVNQQLDRQENLSDQIIIPILNKEIKKLNESKDIYKSSGSLDKIEQIEFEQSIIQSYLPESLSEDKIEKIVLEIIKENPSANFGQLMSLVKDKVGLMSDGSMIAKLIKVNLNLNT